jgi:hypothetical protein
MEMVLMRGEVISGKNSPFWVMWDARNDGNKGKKITLGIIQSGD